MNNVKKITQMKIEGKICTSKLRKLQLILLSDIGFRLDTSSYNLGKMYRCMGHGVNLPK